MRTIIKILKRQAIATIHPAYLRAGMRVLLEVTSSSRTGTYPTLLPEGDMDEIEIESQRKTCLSESGHGQMETVGQSEYAVDAVSRC